MAVNDLLTKDEINALLHSSSDEFIATDEEIAECGGNGVTDQASFSKRFPALEMVNERFSGFFQLALSRLLASTAEVTLDRVHAIKFSDYTHSLFVPTSMNIARFKSFDAMGLFVFDPKLVFILADKYFGGEGRPFNVSEGREFAPTELRVIEMILEKLFVTLKEAWSPIASLESEFIGSEINPQLSNVFKKDDIVVVNTFRVGIDKVEADLHVTMPCAMLISLQELSETIV